VKTVFSPKTKVAARQLFFGGCKLMQVKKMMQVKKNKIEIVYEIIRDAMK
jgi:hypothetical protein